jgi:hypothetical protein
LQYLQPWGYLNGFQLYVPHIHYLLISLYVHVRYVKYLVLCYLFCAPSFSSRLLSWCQIIVTVKVPQNHSAVCFWSLKWISEHSTAVECSEIDEECHVLQFLCLFHLCVHTVCCCTELKTFCINQWGIFVGLLVEWVFFSKFSFPSFDAQHVLMVWLYNLFSKGGCFVLICFTHYDSVYKRVWISSTKVHHKVPPYMLGPDTNLS